jgi:hypothetical protein
MFKVAFPTASEEEEKREMEWVRISNVRDTDSTRLKQLMISETLMEVAVPIQSSSLGHGTYLLGIDYIGLTIRRVTRPVAVHLAPAYGIAELVNVGPRSLRMLIQQRHYRMQSPTLMSLTASPNALKPPPT